MAGTQALAEMAEQPAVIAAIAAARPELHAAIRAAMPAPPRGISILARGSSAHVGVTARYLLEIGTGLPVSMAAPSTVTRYGAQLDVDGHLVLALSQSGRTPEIVDVATKLRERGAVVVAVTNDAASPLAAAAAVTLPVGTGQEQAVPATKTVTGSLALVTVLAEAVGTGLDRFTGGWDALAEVVGEVLAEEGSIARAVEVLAPHPCAVHLARGLTYAAALEGALKSKETSRRIHDGYSSADFLHGPLTVCRPQVPIIAYGAAGPVLGDVIETAQRAAALGSPVIGVGAAALAEGALPVPVTERVGEALAVIPLVVRGQQLAIRTTLALGMDPDFPEGLHKVTATH